MGSGVTGERGDESWRGSGMSSGESTSQLEEMDREEVGRDEETDGEESTCDDGRGDGVVGVKNDLIFVCFNGH